MKPELQRIRIAEACGVADRWHVMKRGLYYRPDAKGYTAIAKEAWALPLAEAQKHEYKRGTGDEWVTIHRAALPDYLNDLNAMHEAEKVIVKSGKMDGFEGYHNTLCIILDDANAIRATAAQRAEAFLRTLNLWEEEG